jgi:hypothetical protein
MLESKMKRLLQQAYAYTAHDQQTGLSDLSYGAQNVILKAKFTTFQEEATGEGS